MSYGFHHFWENSDPIIQAIAFFLIAASCLTWGIILLQVLLSHRMRLVRQKIVHLSLHSPEDLQKLQAQSLQSPFQELLAQAHALDTYVQKNTGSAEKDWIQQHLHVGLRAGEEFGQKSRLTLATIASTAPFVGLLGTVWGIYRTLTQLPTDPGNSILQHIAGPIGETLMMTAMGLLVAIPASIAYNIFSRQLSVIQRSNQLLAFKLYQYLSRTPVYTHP